MQKEQNILNNILNKVSNTSNSLLSLISFLKENDPKFKNFELFSYVNLSAHINDYEDELFYSLLREFNTFTIDKVPNLEEFRNILIKRGANKDKFTIDIVKRFLNAIIFEFNINNDFGFIAYIIINKE